MVKSKWPGLVTTPGEGDAPVPLLVQVVHHGVARVDLPHSLGVARVVQHPLRGGGLPRVNVGHDPNIPDLALAVAKSQQISGLERLTQEASPSLQSQYK